MLHPGFNETKMMSTCRWNFVTPLVLHQVYYFENINEPSPGGYDAGLASKPWQPALLALFPVPRVVIQAQRERRQVTVHCLTV